MWKSYGTLIVKKHIEFEIKFANLRLCSGSEIKYVNFYDFLLSNKSIGIHYLQNEDDVSKSYFFSSSLKFIKGLPSNRSANTLRREGWPIGLSLGRQAEYFEKDYFRKRERELNILLKKR